MRTIAAGRHWRRGIVASLAAIALFAAGCRSNLQDGDQAQHGAAGAAANEQKTPTAGGRLVVAVPNESNGWNPYVDQWGDAGTMVGTSMIEPLVIQNNDGRPQPWLIVKWEPNSDFTQWTLTLRPGVQFHDGTPFNAVAAKMSLDDSYQSGLYQFALGSLYDRVEVVSELAVRVHLKVKWAQYPTSLSNQWVMAPSMLAREDKGVLNPVGTGPFVFESWVQGKSLTVKRFDHYWRKDSRGQQLPYLNEVQFRPILDDAPRELALLQGEVDLALSAAGDIAENLKDDFTVIKDYTGERTFLMINHAVGAANKGNPFWNEHARRALAYATDRDAVAERVGDGVQITTYGFRPDSPWAPDGDDGYYAYDPAKARAEVEAYKRDTRSKSMTFTVMGYTATEAQQVLQLLKEQWAKVGIEANIIGAESAKLTVLVALGQYHAAWFRLHDYPDPDQMNFYNSSSTMGPVGELSLNFTHYASPSLDANLKVLRESTDFGARKRANDAVVRETNQQVVNLWLYDTPESIVARPQVKGLDGFRTHAFSNPQPKPWLADAWLSR